MATKFIDPGDVAAPFGPYSQAVLTTAASQWLHVSGQVGVRPDGSVGDGIDEQSELAWRNVVAALRAAGMAVSDIVKVTAYLTRAGDFAAYAAVRGRHLAAARPASTALIVAALARPEWLVEVEVVAAKA